MVVVMYYYYIPGGYKYKATLHGIETGSPMVVALGRQYNVVEKPTIILYTYINHHAQPPIITQHNHCSTVVHSYEDNSANNVDNSTIEPHKNIGAWVNSKM